MRSFVPTGIVQRDPLAKDVFREGAREERNADFLLQASHAFLPEQADLPVPVSGMGVAVDPVRRAQMRRLDQMLLLPLLFADTDGLDHGALLHHFNTPRFRRSPETTSYEGLTNAV